MKNILGTTYEILDELITRVLCDVAPEGAIDAAYLFGETKDNEMSGLEAGRFLYSKGPAKRIAICGAASGHGYPGYANWEKKLIGAGIPRKDIISVALTKDFPPSTDAEALGLVRHARENNWRTMYVIAPPLHQLRAFISTVSAGIREKSKLKIYSFPGVAQSWEEHIIHSQGIQKGTRSEILTAELLKIEKYYQKGDLVSAKEILRYLDRRDK